MLENTLFVNTSLTKAIEDDIAIGNADRAEFFYNKWNSTTGGSSLATPLEGKLGKMEAEIRIYLEKNQEKYREISEQMYMTHPAAMPFNAIFLRTEELFADRDFYKEYHIRAFKELIDDQIDYVELRCGFQNFTETYGAVPAHKYKFIEYSPEFLEVIMEALIEARKYQKQKARPLKDATEEEEMRAEIDVDNVWKSRPEFNVRVILNARRDLNPLAGDDVAKLVKKVDAAIAWKELEEYSDLILGFDFVSEDDLQTIVKAFYGSPTLRVRAIDFYLHDGESVWTDSGNMIDAVIASRRRIGHGFNMVKSPTVVNHISGVKRQCAAETEIGGLDGPILEICPISNQLLRYFPDLRDHTAFELMERGIQCVISMNSTGTRFS